MALNADQLTTLRAIVDLGSFDAAALELGISASAVSQRIRALEAAVGAIVLHRSTPATTTDVGAQLVQLARQIHLLETEILTDIHLEKSSSEINIAVNADSLATWFTPVLSEAAHWSQGIHLRLADESDTLTLLRQGDVVGAVTTAPHPVAGCTVHPLGAVRYIPAASPQLVEQWTTESTLDWSLPILRFQPRDRFQDNFIAHFGAHASRRNYIPTSEGFLAACTAGLGWALLPLVQAQPLIAAGQLVDLRPMVPHGHPTEATVDLYWQCWKLRSHTLERLTTAVRAAARAGLDS